jgi:hypothetical protein
MAKVKLMVFNLIENNHNFIFLIEFMIRINIVFSNCIKWTRASNLRNIAMVFRRTTKVLSNTLTWSSRGIMRWIKKGTFRNNCTKIKMIMAKINLIKYKMSLKISTVSRTTGITKIPFKIIYKIMKHKIEIISN